MKPESLIRFKLATRYVPEVCYFFTLKRRQEVTPHSKGFWVAVRPASTRGVVNWREKSARSPPLPWNDTTGDSGFGLLTDAEGGHEEPRRAGQHLEVLRSGFVNNQADPRDLRKRGRRKEGCQDEYLRRSRERRIKHLTRKTNRSNRGERRLLARWRFWEEGSSVEDPKRKKKKKKKRKSQVRGEKKDESTSEVADGKDS